MTKKELKSITSRFERGDYAKVAEKTGFSQPYVWRSLNGERGGNSTIFSAAKRLVSRRSK